MRLSEFDASRKSIKSFRWPVTLTFNLRWVAIETDLQVAQVVLDTSAIRSKQMT